MTLSRVVLWISIIGFAGFGNAFLLFPETMAALVDVDLRTDTARADFMATYGGLELGVAAFLFYCTLRDDRLHVGLMAAGLVVSGFAVGRFAGLVIADGTDPVMVIFLGIELFGAAISFWAANRHVRA